MIIFTVTLKQQSNIESFVNTELIIEYISGPDLLKLTFEFKCFIG